MGSIDSRAQFLHGQIFLQTDHSYAIVGDNLTGNIYLNLSQPYPAISLNIVIKGDEKMTMGRNKNKKLYWLWRKKPDWNLYWVLLWRKRSN